MSLERPKYHKDTGKHVKCLSLYLGLVLPVLLLLSVSKLPFVGLIGLLITLENKSLDRIHSFTGSGTVTGHLMGPGGQTGGRDNAHNEMGNKERHNTSTQLPVWRVITLNVGINTNICLFVRFCKYFYIIIT